MASSNSLKVRKPRWPLFLIAVLVVVGLSTTSAFAYGETQQSQSAVQPTVSTAAESPKYGTAPAWNPVAGAVGGITQPGDLFYIDLRKTPGDRVVTLYLTNPHELIRDYAYLNMKIGVYAQGEEGRDGVGKSGWQAIGNSYLTLSNSQVSFTVAGGQVNAIAVDGGAYYVIQTNAEGGSLSPQFYCTIG